MSRESERNLGNRKAERVTSKNVTGKTEVKSLGKRHIIKLAGMLPSQKLVVKNNLFVQENKFCSMEYDSGIKIISLL